MRGWNYNSEAQTQTENISDMRAVHLGFWNEPWPTNRERGALDLPLFFLAPTRTDEPKLLALLQGTIITKHSMILQALYISISPTSNFHFPFTCVVMVIIRPYAIKKSGRLEDEFEIASIYPSHFPFRRFIFFATFLHLRFIMSYPMIGLYLYFLIISLLCYVQIQLSTITQSATIEIPNV
ncbi:hypothetical protein DFH27DRAFT_16468 [Peziza echinospora]|nr:hypothetical protein DFH27DRAFT_16468 [Peziza echinospora]